MDTVFFVISKLAWAVLRPESLLLIAQAASLVALWRGRRALAGAGFGVTLAAFMTIGILPLGDLLLRPLEHRFSATPDLRQVAGIVVLGGGETPEEAAVWNQPQVTEAGDRFLAAIALARQHPEAWVMFTGGSGQLGGSAMPEADVARDIFLSTGIDPDRLILEPNSRNTAENAVFSRAVRPASDGTWILVTSAFHMPRAVGAFCRAGWRNVTPWPVDYRTARFHRDIGWNLSKHLVELNTAWREWIGLLAYRATGRITALFPAGCP